MTGRIYYRVSTEKQDFAMQKYALERLVSANGMNVCDCVIYDDYAITGTTANRPDYQRLLSDLREGDTIFVYEFSRLWRDMEEQSRATKMFIALGVRVCSVSDGNLKDTNDRLTAGIKGVINEYEVTRLRERIRAGIAAKQARAAKGEEVWKGRGPDKKKRKTDGYKIEQERRRQLKNIL